MKKCHFVNANEFSGVSPKQSPILMAGESHAQGSFWSSFISSEENWDVYCESVHMRTCVNVRSV